MTVPHTTDLRIEAWVPNRAGCIRQAMLSTVESLLDTSSAHPQRTYRRRLTGDKRRRLLVAALEEVIYSLDTADEAPVDLTLTVTDGSVDVDFTMVDASTLPQVGAVPKALSLNELRFSHGQEHPTNGTHPRRNERRLVIRDARSPCLTRLDGARAYRPRRPSRPSRGRSAR